MNCKVIHVEEEGKNYPGLTIYTIERQPVGFKFNVNMWDNGMFTIKSLKDKQIGYSTELKNEALKAINKYKLKQDLNPSTAKTFEELIDEL
jgi:hypothetical protein